MPLYRVHKNLAMGSKVIERGSLAPIHLPPEKIDKLIDVGAISRVSAPPLAILNGWASRAERLEKIGIVNVEQFLDADVTVIMKHLRVKEATVLLWREDVVSSLLAKPATG